jgi:PAS domain S-box-containing protein
VYKRPTGEGVRVDDAFEEGMAIPIFYDPMIAKLVVHAPSRILAIEKATKAINDYIIKGVKTTLGFGKFAINHEAFVSGKFDTDFRPKSNKDILGKTLVDMRKSLQNADEKDNVRNWVVTGVAEIGEILRNNINLELLGYDILEYTCLRIGALQGAFYIIDNENGVKIKSSASYAFNKKKHLDISFDPGAGLVGQVYLEKKPLIRTEIPDGYPSITSGLLGEQKPHCIAIFPLITNDIVYGIMEFASFQQFDSGTLSFLEEISEGISRTIFYIKVNEHTKLLLTDSQDMSQELQQKQSELEKNAEQMAQSQEELSESNTKLGHQVSEVNHAQSRTEALLKNASEVIMIFDKDNNIKYVSPSAEKIIGYREEDLLGSDDLHLVDRQFVADYQNMFTNLVSNKKTTDHLQLKYYKKTGDKIWLEVTGTNLLADPSVDGIVFNFQDITERIRAQEEERKKGQMQALSENSLDLITRIGAKDLKVYYANPIIKQYTGITPKKLINASLKDSGLHKIIWSDWKSFVEKVKTSGKTHTTEMVFPTEHEHMVMEVNAMPEFDEQNEIESVLIVSHDITEKKRIENEIKSTNVKIQDSINYAENIQKTIIPDENLLKESFKESLIVFKPKDIVSGDFPWYFKKDNTVFLAAVDCTGHGVPGAMISFVGYFLLNNIVQHNTHCSAGEILDLLDAEVTDTFKQDDENSTIKDGMDMALCKVNLDNGLIEYAGAQRPLYLLKKNGLIVETKGSKFPIGGGSAYNKTGFTNSIIKAESGDGIFIFSDGLPDQFGGDNGTQKLGPRRIKQILETNHSLPLNELNDCIENELKDWMKETSQTDDIILLGFRV